MIGLINNSIKDFIVDTYGTGVWERVLDADPATFGQPFITACPFSDEISFRCVWRTHYALVLGSPPHGGCVRTGVKEGESPPVQCTMLPRLLRECAKATDLELSEVLESWGMHFVVWATQQVSASVQPHVVAERSFSPSVQLPRCACSFLDGACIFTMIAPSTDVVPGALVTCVMYVLCLRDTENDLTPVDAAMQGYDKLLRLLGSNLAEFVG